MNKLILLILFFIFLNNTVHANNIKNSAVVFMYHKFGQQDYPSTNIRIDQFEQHLEEFSKSKYNVLSIEYIIDTIINDGQLPNNTIGITIDDADDSFLTEGWPRLKERGFPVTLFITASTISNNSNYLNWNQIRQLQEEGVTIGSHSLTHEHMANFTIEKMKNEIEKSNKIFLKEIGRIPTLFAFPYGETDEKFIDLLKEYKFKVAFGQHSGVINETSNLYYLPRFSLNEKYGEIDRVVFASNTKGLGVYDFVPTNPNIQDNPPFIGFSLLDQMLSKNIACFIFDSAGEVGSDMFKFNERVEIRLNRNLNKGRTRLNCTAKDKNGNWRWFGHQFFYN